LTIGIGLSSEFQPQQNPLTIICNVWKSEEKQPQRLTNALKVTINTATEKIIFQANYPAIQIVRSQK
jgi:hypothetical protein